MEGGEFQETKTHIYPQDSNISPRIERAFSDQALTQDEPIALSQIPDVVRSEEQSKGDIKTSQLPARKSQSSGEDPTTSRVGTQDRQRSTSDQSQVQTPDTIFCICKQTNLTCSMFHTLISKICDAKRSEMQEKLKELSDFLSKEQISLAAMFCPYSGETPKTVLMTILEEVPNGCNIIKDQLDNLKEFDDEENIIRIKLGNGKLFEDQENQAQILKDLLSVRNRTKQGSSHEALTGLIKHPVTVIFLLEKWKNARTLFIIHLR